MLNYEEELKKFKPSLEVEEIEEAVYQELSLIHILSEKKSRTNIPGQMQEKTELQNRKMFRPEIQGMF